jgi:tetratricopeptide (TPR) repeat protein
MSTQPNKPPSSARTFGKGTMEDYSARDSLADGYEALRNRDFAAAALAFGRGATLEPDNPALLYGAALAARRQGDFHLAESRYRAAIEVAQRRPEGDAASFLAIATRLVELYRRQDRDAEAEALCLRALESQYDGRSAIARSRLYVCLADIYRRHEQWAAAEKAYWAAIGFRREAFGDWHPKTIQILPSLADMCRRRGRHGQADELTRRYREALKTPEHTRAAGHA